MWQKVSRNCLPTLNISTNCSDDNLKSLSFYYANYSNPFSEDDQVRLGRTVQNKEVGDDLFYEDCSGQRSRSMLAGLCRKEILLRMPIPGLEDATEGSSYAGE